MNENSELGTFYGYRIQEIVFYRTYSSVALKAIVSCEHGRSFAASGSRAEQLRELTEVAKSKPPTVYSESDLLSFFSSSFFVLRSEIGLLLDNPENEEHYTTVKEFLLDVSKGKISD